MFVRLGLIYSLFETLGTSFTVCTCEGTHWLQGSTQGHWRFPKEGQEQGLVYLMTHPGTPCMFYDDLQDNNKKDLMQRLIALRQNAGIHCRSKVSCDFITPTYALYLWSAAPLLICMQCVIFCRSVDEQPMQACCHLKLQMCSFLCVYVKLICCVQVYIMHAQKFLYVAEIDGSLLMKIGKAKYEPDSNRWKPLESGKDWGIWQQA